MFEDPENPGWLRAKAMALSQLPEGTSEEDIEKAVHKAWNVYAIEDWMKELLKFERELLHLGHSPQDAVYSPYEGMSVKVTDVERIQEFVKVTRDLRKYRAKLDWWRGNKAPPSWRENVRPPSPPPPVPDPSEKILERLKVLEVMQLCRR